MVTVDVHPQKEKTMSMLKRSPKKLLTIPSSSVEIDLPNARFGYDYDPEAEVQVAKAPVKAAVPDNLADLDSQLRGESRLLRLRSGPDLDRDEVLEAYGHDLALLRQRFLDLSGCVKQAVRCSIVVGGDHKMTPKKAEERIEAIWKELQENLPLPTVNDISLKLPYTLAAQEAQVILQTLRTQFEESLVYVLQSIGAQLQVLIDNEHVGLLSWAGDDACCYHYFRH